LFSMAIVGANFSLVLSIACGGNYIWEWILQHLISFNRFFFPDGQGSPLEGIIIFVSSLHLIGYLSSKALSMKPYI
jgi:hypothetical protein